MAKTASSAPEFKLPEFKLPKVDLEAVFALQRANLAVAHEAQSVMLEATQALMKLGFGFYQDAAEQAQAKLSGKQPAKPEAVVAEFQATAEKAVATAKEGVDLSVAAQRKVADLVAKRFAANVEELKALAA